MVFSYATVSTERPILGSYLNDDKLLPACPTRNS